jgi:hypothetical protein
MFGIPLPWLLLGLSIALFGTYRGGYHFGWADRDAEMQIAIARKNEEAREVERSMTSKVIAQTNKLQEANDALNQKTTALDRAIRAGRVRFPTASCVQAPTSTTAATPDRNDEASESERQTLAAIAAIVAEGDAAINQLNACITSYNEVRSLINGQ